MARFGDFSESSAKFPVKWTAPESLKNNVGDLFVCQPLPYVLTCGVDV